MKGTDEAFELSSAEKVNGGQNICSRDASVGNEKHLRNKLNPLKVMLYMCI